MDPIAPRELASPIPMRHPRRPRFDPGVLAVGAAALALRLPYLIDRSVWYDEASSWQTASFEFADLIRSNRLNVHMPLYYLLLKGWFAAFGDSVAALRGFSVAWGIATVLLADRFARAAYLASRAADEAEWDPAARRGHARAFGLTVALMVACSPFAVLGSIEARMYSLGSALATLVGWLALRLLAGRGRVGDWAGFGLAGLALLYTHNYGPFTVAAAGGALGASGCWALGSGRWAEARRLLIPLGIVGVLVALLYLPGLGILSGQVERVRRDYWIKPLGWDEVARTFAEFALPLPEDREPRPIGWLPAALFAASVVVVAAGRWRPGEVMVLALAVGPMALAASLSTWTPVWVPRYFRLAFPAILAVVALAGFLATTGRPWLRRGLAAGLVGGLLALNAPFWGAMDLRHNPGPRAVAARILAEHRPGELVVAADLHQYFVLKYYLRRSGARVRLVRAAFEPYWGPHLIRPGDFLAPGEVGAIPPGGSCWVVGHGPRATVPDLPAGARVVAEADATSPLHLHRHVFATRYLIPRPEDAP